VKNSLITSECNLDTDEFYEGDETVSTKTEKREMTSLRFTISGEFLTEHFRGLVLEENWTGAIKGLMDSLIGVTYDQVISILSGENRLIGDTARDEDIQMVKDTCFASTKKYLEDVEFLYGHLYKENKATWRPYAVVTNWGPHDVYPDYKFHYDSGLKSIAVRRRSSHYMNNKSQDRLHTLNMKIDESKGLKFFRGLGAQMLFEKSDATVPIWYTVKKTAQQALDSYVKLHGYPEERGHQEWYPCPHETDSLGEKIIDKNSIKKDLDKLGKILSDSKNQLRDYDTSDEAVRQTQEVVDEAVENIKKDIVKVTAEIEEKNDLIKEMKADEESDRQEKIRQRVIRDAVEEAKEKKYQAELIRMRTDIKSQAEKIGGFFDLVVEREGKDSETYKVPLVPFQHWAMKGSWIFSAHFDKLEKWPNISYSGMKMYGDNPDHTDWVLGADLNLEDMYGFDEDKELTRAAYEAMQEIQEEVIGKHGTHSITLLNAGKEAEYLSGSVKIFNTKSALSLRDEDDDCIAVVRTASPKYVALLGKVKMIIVENGGALCHLATVAKEQDCTIIRMKDATKILADRQFIRLKLRNLELEVL
jgi:phosphohistidine swiveling domain-containing protein